MKAVTRHLSKCFVARIVAILPIGGLIVTVGYLGITVADSGLDSCPGALHSWPEGQVAEPGRSVSNNAQAKRPTPERLRSRGAALE